MSWLRPPIFVALCSFAVLAALPAQQPRAPAPAVTVPIWPNSTCAIMGKKVSTRLFVDIEYGRMYVCCKSCNKKIQRDPHGTYKTAYPVTKPAGNQTCPISGKPIGDSKQTVLLQGHEIALCSADCVAKAQADAQVTLAKVNTPDVVDVANRACPITGAAVVPNAYVLIDRHLVRLSSPDCVAKVEQDPRAALAKAQDRTREPKPAEPEAKPPATGTGKDK
jgi:hypothetical protein